MSTTRDEFEAWWAQEIAMNGGISPGADYRHWALVAWQASRRAALEEAAKTCEDLRDLKESARAQKAADEAIARDDKGDMLSRLRHCSTVSLFNGSLERAAKAIRALAGGTQEGQSCVATNCVMTTGKNPPECVAEQAAAAAGKG